MKKIVNAFFMLTLCTLFTVACSTPMTDPVPSTEEELSLPVNQIQHFSLTQPWFAELESNFRKGEVAFRWTPQALIVHAVLSDDAVYTTSDADNQHMWELGDVFEMFVQIEGHEDYFELHITPANTRFQAHKPNVVGTDSSGEWKPIEHWMVSPVGFSAEANKTEGGWTASMEIPPSVLGLTEFTPDSKFRIAFARYDGASDREPTLSASAPHAPSETVSFHIPKDWHRILLQN